MKIHVRHAYPCSPARFWEMYWDEGFDAELQAGATVDREVVSETRDGGKLVRRLRFVPHQELPSAVAAVVGSPKLTYEQLNTFDEAAGRMTWEVLPSFLPGKFSASGTLTVVPKGSGCEMQVDGEINVRVMFIGGQVEKQVVSQIEDGYKRMLDLGQKWLARPAVT